MTIEFLTFDPIEIWAQDYGPEVCKYMVPHCELVHEIKPIGGITVFKYRLSDRGEMLLALTNQGFLDSLRKSEAQRAARRAALDSEDFREENPQ